MSALFHALRTYETVLYLTILLSPVWLTLGHALHKNLAHILPPEYETTTKGYILKLCSYVSVALFCLSITYVINALLDKSEQHVCKQSINNKTISHGKGGARYHVEIPSCTPSIFSFFELDTYENISVSKDVYDRVQINQSIGTIIYKSGYLNIPWRTSGYVRDEYVQKPYLLRFKSESMDSDFIDGLAYFTGTGKSINYEKAIASFQKAVNRGNALAQHDLAYMYLNGLGTPKNPTVAAQLIWQSADQGYALAQDYLGVMYGDGRDGVEQSWIKSYIWINRAAKQGYDQAIKDLEYVKSHMTPEQLQQAEQQN